MKRLMNSTELLEILNGEFDSDSDFVPLVKKDQDKLFEIVQEPDYFYITVYDQDGEFLYIY